MKFKTDNEPSGVAKFWMSIALCAAARSANFHLLQNLLAAGVDVNSTWGIQSAILLCVETHSWRLEKRLLCLRLLLEQPDVELNILDRYGQPIIYVAIGKGEAFVRLLLEFGRDRLLLDVLAKGEEYSARETIKRKYPLLISYLNRIPVNRNADKMNKLLQLLWTNQDLKFVEIFNTITVNDNCDCRLFLYWATKKFLPGSTKAVLELVSAMKKNPVSTVRYTLRDYHLCMWALVLGGRGKVNQKVKCLEHFKREITPEAWHLQLNGQSHLAYSSFHYALKDEENEIAMTFLARGANILMRNRLGKRPLDNCTPEFLEKFFDSLINNKGGICSINIRKLRPLPPIGTEDFSREKHSCQPYHEIELINELSKIPKLRRLLSHPVLTCFIFMKWHRVKSFYYANAIFYTVFCALLITYVALSSTPGSIGDDAVDSNSTVAILSPNSNGIVFLKAMTAFAIFILLIREIFQLILKKWEYWRNWENWLELNIVGQAIYLVASDITSNDATLRHIAVISITFACFELFLLLGRHPRFSMKVEMLKRVTVSFAKFLDLLLFIVITFSIGFYLMFSASDKYLPKENVWSNQLSSFFKSLVMVSGEFDSENIPFLSFPGTSHVLFLIFVFLATVVLVNLLVGLAVSDVQQISADAYLYSCVARVNFINVIEETLLEIKRRGWERLCFGLLYQKVFVFSSKNYYQTLSVNYSEEGSEKWEFNGNTVWTFSVDQHTVSEIRSRRIKNSEEGGDLALASQRFQGLEGKLNALEGKLDMILYRRRNQSNAT